MTNLRRPATTRSGLWRLALLCALLPLTPAAFAAPRAAAVPQTHRYTVIMLGSKVGTQTVRLAPATYQRKKAVRLTVESSIKVQALGEVEQRVRATEILTPAGRPLRLDMAITSAGRTTSVRALFHPNRVECLHTAGGKVMRKTVRIPRGVRLSEDPSLVGTGGSAATVRVGQRLTQHYFEPLTMTIQKFEAEVVRREALRVGDGAVDAFVLRIDTALIGQMYSWVAQDGDLLKMEAPLGLAVVRDDLVRPEEGYKPPSDFAVATSIRTERKIANPRQTRSLRLRLEGVSDRSLVLTDRRQQATVEGEGQSLTVIFQIEAADPPVQGAPAATRRQGNPLLADATYLNLDDPEIKKRVGEIVGAEKDRAAIARRIRAWVHAHMRKPSNIGVPRSAVEIMKSREGVCRDYATLFTALARAAGVPTRLVAGIVYAPDGFFYHAWAECQVGPGADDWIAYDPTLPTDFVDATHLKFTQGNVEDMFRSARLIGQLKAEVLEVR